MIPQCYPSVINTATGAREMQVFILSSVSGLVRWTDYIPIKLSGAENPKQENTTGAGGYIPIKALSSTTGKTSWVDYVPVYVDASATDAWQCSNVGYIPYSYGATLNLSFITSSSLPSTITFSRADATTCATYFNSSGVLATAAANVPRFDYDPVTLAPRGLLIEESRTNLCIYNSDLNNAIWTTKTNLTLGTGIVSPTGATDGFRLTATGTSGVWQQVATVVATSVYTASVWVRRVSGTGAIGFRCCEIAGTTIVPTSTWQRFSFTNTASTTTGRIGITTTNADDVIEVYGFQLELGSFPTSYIPTTTASATRAADSVSMTGTNFSSWYNQSAGTFVVEADDIGQTSPNATRILQADDGTEANRIALIDNGGAFRALGTVASVSQADQTIAWTGSNRKGAFTYATNDFQWAASGVLGMPDTSGTLPTPTQIRFGALVTGTSGAIYIKRVSFYPARLPNATLQSLTS